MKPQFPRPITRFLAAFVACTASLFLGACDSIPTSNTRYIRVDPVEHSGFNTGDLKQAFASVYATFDQIADEHFGPESGNYQRIRLSVPVKIMMFGPNNFTPYEFEEVVLKSAQLQEIRDQRGSLWTRYAPNDPTRLRRAKTDLYLMFMSQIVLDKSASAESGETSEPRFLYEWKIMKTGGDGTAIAQGKEPLRAQNPAALRLKPETR